MLVLQKAGAAKEWKEILYMVQYVALYWPHLPSSKLPRPMR